MTVPVYKDGKTVVAPILTVPCEIMVRVDGPLNPVLVRIEYDEDGLHFFNSWGMATLSEQNVIEEAPVDETSDSVLSQLHD